MRRSHILRISRHYALLFTPYSLSNNVGNQRNSEDFDSQVSSRQNFVHRAHSRSITSNQSEEVTLRRCFITRTWLADIHTFLEKIEMALRLDRSAENFAKLFVVGVAKGREASSHRFVVATHLVQTYIRQLPMGCYQTGQGSLYDP